MSVFDLSEIQAQYILDTPLRRLTRYDRLELERERETLQAEIAELTAILDSEARLRELVSAELADVAERFADPRRTVLLEGSGADPDRRGAAGGGRRPVHGAAVLGRAARADRRPPAKTAVRERGRRPRPADGAGPRVARTT